MNLEDFERDEEKKCIINIAQNKKYLKYPISSGNHCTRFINYKANGSYHIEWIDWLDSVLRHISNSSAIHGAMKTSSLTLTLWPKKQYG